MNIIQKLRLYLAYIEAFIGRWDQSIFGDLENSGHVSAEYVGQLFKVKFKKCYQNTLDKYGTTISFLKGMCVGNTKEKPALLIWNWAKTK